LVSRTRLSSAGEKPARNTQLRSRDQDGMTAVALLSNPFRVRSRPVSVATVTMPVESTPDLALLGRLRAGDESAFAILVDTHGPTMLKVARTYVRSHAVAEEVVQEAWLGVFNGIDRFEGRSSLRTWILRIVVNIAITRGTKESRSVPLSSLATGEDGPSIELDRFRAADDVYPGHWLSYPTDWRTLPATVLEAKETLEVVKEAIEGLPEMQRLVITLRDVAGMEPDEVREALGLTDGNQRVLLHRARSRVRSRLEEHLDAV
jgi:RNA polymerase sigma-70 factor, ECF subfamily